MMVNIEEMLRKNMELQTKDVITSVKSLNGVVYEVEGFNASGTFVKIIGLLIVEIKEKN